MGANAEAPGRAQSWEPALSGVPGAVTAPGTVQPLRLASQVPICSRFLCRPILQSQGIDGEGLPRPSGTTPQIQQRKPPEPSFLSFGRSQELQIPSTRGTTSQPRVTGLHVETASLTSTFLTGTGRVSSSPRPANEHETPRLRLSRTPRNISHRGTRRRSVPMPHSHPEGPVQVTLVSRSKLLSSPPFRLT